MGGQVTIVVAQAFKQIAVPTVVGKSEVQAVATLTAAGFTSATVTRTVSEPPRWALSSSRAPPPAHKLAKGATVTIAVGAVGRTNHLDVHHNHDAHDHHRQPTLQRPVRPLECSASRRASGKNGAT